MGVGMGGGGWWQKEVLTHIYLTQTRAINKYRFSGATSPDTNCESWGAVLVAAGDVFSFFFIK